MNICIEHCDKKIESWNGYNYVDFSSKFCKDEIEAMIIWMESDCPFDIDSDYFVRMEEDHDFEYMRDEVLMNYINRRLMYMIDQGDVRLAAHWYNLWKCIH